MGVWGLTYSFTTQVSYGMQLAICVIPYKSFPVRFHSSLSKIFMPRTWQYNRNAEWIAKKMCVCACMLACMHQLLHKTDLHINGKCHKIPIKLWLKQYPFVTSLESLFSNVPKIFMPRTWLISPNCIFLCWK